MNKDSEALMKGTFFHDYEFGVKHYAGTVTYDANYFLTQNLDTLPSDVTECKKKSTNIIVMAEIACTVRTKSKPKAPTGVSEV